MPRKRKNTAAEDITAAKHYDAAMLRKKEEGKQLITIQVPRAWCEYVKQLISAHEYQTILTTQQEQTNPDDKVLQFLYREIKLAKRAADILREQMRHADQMLDSTDPPPV